METFGQRFQRLRKERNLTQEDIAKKVNMSYQAISKWENDITSPDISLLNTLSTILDVSLDTLLGKEVVTSLEPTKDLSKLMLKIICIDNADKVNINIPVLLIKICLESNLAIPNINDKNIDFKAIFNLIENGVIGELMTIQSEDGSNVVIKVE